MYLLAKCKQTIVLASSSYQSGTTPAHHHVNAFKAVTHLSEPQ
jgi:hypothetical protein